MMTARRVLASLLAGTALLATACGGLPESSADVAKSVADGDLGAARVLRGQVFAERDTGPLKLDLYLPEATDGPVPLVVYIHGGSWEAGTRYLGGAVAESGATESLAAERLVRDGYAVATVDYRLSGIVPAPAQIIDVADAVHWLQGKAGQWNLDADRIALWGASAGGHVASLLGTIADGSGPVGRLDGIRAVVNWFGPSDMSAAAEQRHPEIGDYERRVVEQYLGCPPALCPEEADASSPVKNLSGEEPPFLLQHGTADEIVPLEQSLDFAAEARRHGIIVEMHPYEGVGHGFKRGPMRQRVIDSMVAFVQTLLAA